MKKLVVTIPLVLFTLILSESVQAQSVDYARPAWYVSVAGTFDIHLFESEVKKAFDGVVDLENAWGIDLKVGRRLLYWLSFELEYEYVDGFDFNVDGIKILSLQVNTLTGNVKFHYPFRRFIPYAVAGIGGTWYNVKDEAGLGIGFESDTALAGRFGAGIDIFLTERWAINTSYTFVLTTYDLTNPTKLQNISGVYYGALQLGIAYYFSFK